MKIPQQVKIGGKNYTVEQTNNLHLGRKHYSGEVDYENLVIRICLNAKETMETTLLHEILHAVHTFLGYSNHNEKRISELANTLYMIIQDNSEMFERGE